MLARGIWNEFDYLYKTKKDIIILKNNLFKSKINYVLAAILGSIVTLSSWAWITDQTNEIYIWNVANKIILEPEKCRGLEFISYATEE